MRSLGPRAPRRAARLPSISLLLVWGAGCAGGASPAAPPPPPTGEPVAEAPPPAPPSPAPPAPPGPPAAVAPPGARLAAGGDFTCAIDADGAVLCWGSNRFGQLGAPDLPTGLLSVRAEALPVVGLPPAVAIAAGAFHACALDRAGTLRCWGHGGHGQLGDGGREDHATPRRVEGLPAAVDVTVGRAHGCAADREGGVWCWGANDRAQLGREGEGGPDPRPVPGLSDVARVRAGRDHTCALRHDGVVLCWGDATEGALGDGSPPGGTGMRAAPLPAALPAGVAAVGLAAGGGSTCALLEGGEVRCWGRDDSGQLGTGRGGDPDRVEPRPRPVPDLAGAVALSLGSRHGCALDAAGAALCAGWNGRGQLGDGTDRTRNRYAPVLEVGAVEEVSAGARHTCARLAGGTIRCWGDARRAQLGFEATSQLPP